MAGMFVMLTDNSQGVAGLESNDIQNNSEEHR
jgi:hypothetical protein